MHKFLFYLLFFISYQTFAHNGVILGTVKDQASGHAIYGASISLKNTNKATFSNDFGQFRLTDIPEGKYEIKVSFIGFQSQIQSIEISDHQNLRLAFNLQKSAIELQNIEITSVNPHEHNIISSFDIKLRPINNSQDVLRFVPGLLMGQHAGGGKAEQIFLRGFDIDHGTDIQLSADGMPVNMVSHAHGQGYSDLHFIIPELIENVEFKKGMYHASKGNFSTAGWVNFKTKSTLEKNMAKVEVGQFNTYRLMTAAKILDSEKQKAYLAGEYNYSDSYFDHSQDFNRLNLLGKYHSHFGKTSLNLTASTFWSKWSHSGQIPDRAVESGLIGFYGSIDPTEGGETSRTNLNAEFSTITRKNHIFKNQIYYTNYNFLLYSNFTFFLENPVFGDQIKQKENRNLLGYNGSYHIQHNLGNKNAELSIGANYRQDFTQNSELSNTYNKITLLNNLMLGNVNEANAALYVEESIDFSQKLKLNLGLRYDLFFNKYKDILTPEESGKANAGILLPKLNVYYNPSQNFQVYLNSGRGFHSNDTRVAVPQNGKQVLPGAYGTDLGFNTKITPRLFINAAYWYLWLAQEFVYVGDAGVVEPSGKSVRQGIDFSVRYQILNNLFFDTDVNWTRPRAIEEIKGEDYIPLAPIFTSMGGLTLNHKTGFNGSLRYRYVANRPANEDNSVIAKGYFVNDLQLNYTQNKYQIGLSIQNIFNTKWKETQFNTLTQLKNEAEPVEEIHFTPGTPFSSRLSFTWFF